MEAQLRQTPVTSSELPESLFRYVVRTHEKIVLDDATAQNLFSEDEYIQHSRPRSVLCLPLVKQSKLKGVLYLENNLAPGVFTPKRLAMLELLASQAAISLDNARLYGELAQENSERRKAEEALRASEDRWRRLFENSSAGLGLIAPDGRYLATNLALQKMLGYTEEELRRSEAFLAQGQRISHTGDWGWQVATGAVYWSEEHFHGFLSFRFAEQRADPSLVYDRARFATRDSSPCCSV